MLVGDKVGSTFEPKTPAVPVGAAGELDCVCNGLEVALKIAWWCVSRCRVFSLGHLRENSGSGSDVVAVTGTIVEDGSEDDRVVSS